MEKSVIEKVCRFCSAVTDKTVEIFSDEAASLLVCISKYLPINVSANDSLPDTACQLCVEQMLSWHKFVELCTETDARWRDTAHKGVFNKNSYGHLLRKEGDADFKDTDKSYNDSDDEPLIKKVNSNNYGSHTYESNQDDDGFTSTDEYEPKVTPRDKYACDLCGKTLFRKSALANHISFCLFRNRVSCNVCGLFYKSQLFLDKHMETEHNSSLEECQECHNYVRESKMRQHMKTVHNVKSRDYQSKRPMPCKYCDTKFGNRHLRSQHTKLVHMKETLKCLQCDFTGRRENVIRHVKARHSDDVYECSMCYMTFRQKSVLKGHLMSHSDTRRYTCDVCGKSFKRLNAVKEHSKIHLAKSLQCQICGKFFQRKRYLAMHEKTIHNLNTDGSEADVNKIECTVCGKQLKWKKNLIAHMRIHTGEKPFWCKICNTSFICHGALRSHMSKHDVAHFEVPTSDMVVNLCKVKCENFD